MWLARRSNASRRQRGVARVPDTRRPALEGSSVGRHRLGADAKRPCLHCRTRRRHPPSRRSLHVKVRIGPPGGCSAGTASDTVGAGTDSSRPDPAHPQGRCQGRLCLARRVRRELGNGRVVCRYGNSTESDGSLAMLGRHPSRSSRSMDRQRIQSVLF